MLSLQSDEQCDVYIKISGKYQYQTGVTLFQKHNMLFIIVTFICLELFVMLVFTINGM